MAKLGFRVFWGCATPPQMPIRAQKGPIRAQKGPIRAPKGDCSEAAASIKTKVWNQHLETNEPANTPTQSISIIPGRPQPLGPKTGSNKPKIRQKNYAILVFFPVF